MSSLEQKKERGTKRPKVRNGAGHFKKNEKGVWEGRKMVGRTPKGNPKIVVATGRTQKECENKLKFKEEEWKRSMLDGARIKKMTVAELCMKHFCHDNNSKGSRLKKSTSKDRRETTIRNQIDGSSLGMLQVGSVTPENIWEFINDLFEKKSNIKGKENELLSVSTIKKAYDVVNAAYNWAVRMGYLKENPCDKYGKEIIGDLKAREDIKDANVLKIKVFSETQWSDFEKTCQIRNKNNGELKYPNGKYAIFLKETGMRIGELCALRFHDIEVENGITMVLIESTRNVSRNRNKSGIGDIEYQAYEDMTKNAKARRIALSVKAAESWEEIKLLRPNAGDDDYVVVNRRGNPTTPDKLLKCFNTIYKAAGLKDITGAHILRRMYATEKYREGKSIDAIAAYIGDTPETVRKHYVSTQETLDAGAKGVINYIPAL